MALWPVIAVLALGAVAWNGSRFIGTKPAARSKDVDFLPSPVVARAMSLGQPTAVAKLRWIDSFAYFQRQIDLQDDHVAGGDPRGGFERLYDTLISLDPLFKPFYEHAVLNTSGVLRQHRTGLSFLMRGLIALPYDQGLWRLASSELAVSFDWTRRNPKALDAWLAAWQDAEASEAGKQMVRDWRRGLAFSNVAGLETLPYWLEQLAATKPGTAMGDYVDGTVRDLLAQHGAKVLPALAGRPLLPWGPVRLENTLMRPGRSRVAAWSPLAADGTLRPDPYGWAWRWSGDQVVSPGHEHVRFLKRSQPLRLAIQAESDKRGRSPRDVAEAGEWGFALPTPPDGGVWLFDDRLPAVRWPAPPLEPWKLR